VTFAEAEMDGVTVMVKDCVGPLQSTPPFENTGVTVIVPVIGFVVLFVAVKPGILPLPFVASPIAALLFVQVNVEAVPLKFTSVVDVPLQTV
jgi:hypothetical protein